MLKTDGDAKGKKGGCSGISSQVTPVQNEISVLWLWGRGGSRHEQLTCQHLHSMSSFDFCGAKHRDTSSVSSGPMHQLLCFLIVASTQPLAQVRRYAVWDNPSNSASTSSSHPSISSFWFSLSYLFFLP